MHATIAASPIAIIVFFIAVFPFLFFSHKGHKEHKDCCHLLFASFAFFVA